MKYSVITGLTALCALSGGLYATDEAPEAHTTESLLNVNNDHGLWLTQDLFFDLADKWNGHFHFEQRNGSDYRLWWYYEYEFTLTYNLTNDIQNWLGLCPDSFFKLFSIGPGWNEFTQLQKNTLGDFRWVWINKPLIEANLNVEWEGWELKQRLRGEFIRYCSSHYHDYDQLRYRLILYAPWKFTRFNIGPFVYNEFFFRKNKWSHEHPTRLVGGLFENRLRVGLAASFIPKKFSGEVWWQWRPLKQPPTATKGWFDTYQWGCSVYFWF